MSRESVYVCNIVKCRPPGNRNPHVDELKSCRPILDRQLELLQPKVIVTLGNVATKGLIPHAEGIAKMRGTLQSYRGIMVIPTYHPLYLIRSPSHLSQAWEDLRVARLKLFAP